MKTWKHPEEIKTELAAHLWGDGTMNDSTTEELFREWYHIDDGRELDLEIVEQWAVETIGAED